MTHYEEINRLTKAFFGMLTFEELELIFDTKLIGLSISDTELVLKELREEWDELDWNEALSIMQEYDKEIE